MNKIISKTKISFVFIGKKGYDNKIWKFKANDILYIIYRDNQCHFGILFLQCFIHHLSNCVPPLVSVPSIPVLYIYSAVLARSPRPPI